MPHLRLNARCLPKCRRSRWTRCCAPESAHPSSTWCSRSVAIVAQATTGTSFAGGGARGCRAVRRVGRQQTAQGVAGPQRVAVASTQRFPHRENSIVLNAKPTKTGEGSDKLLAVTAADLRRGGPEAVGDVLVVAVAESDRKHRRVAISDPAGGPPIDIAATLTTQIHAPSAAPTPRRRRRSSSSPGCNSRLDHPDDAISMLSQHLITGRWRGARKTNDLAVSCQR